MSSEEAIDQERFNEAMKNYVASRPLPEEHELDDAECHNCGEPWEEDEWEERYIRGTPEIPGETWKWTCPGCGHETFEVGW